MAYLVPTNGILHPTQFKSTVRATENKLDSATSNQQAGGLLWYPRARDIAEEVGTIARKKGGWIRG